MAVTIIAIVVLCVVTILFIGLRFLYSLFTTHTMDSSTSTVKAKVLDIFLYLGIAISLVTSVTNLLQIIFTAIDRRFTDVLSQFTYVDEMQSDTRFAIASLLVMFPIYLGLSWYTSSDIKKFLYKRDLPVRKFMIYGTLFVTVLTLIGTLVSVIYTYLGGEMSLRFACKAGAVFITALALFGYYFYSLKRDYVKITKVPLFLALGISLLVITIIVWSISIIGTPSKIRAMKIDNARLSDISRIQMEILNRFQTTDKLPVSLTELDNAFQGYQVPNDPVTKDPYMYKVIDQGEVKVNYTTNKKELVSPAIFTLCATFDTERNYDARGQTVAVGTDMDGYSANMSYYDGDKSPFWNHGKGLVCFKRVIKSDMYYGR